MSRKIHKHLYKHRNVLEKCIIKINNSNIFPKFDDNFNFNTATMLAYIHNKKLRQIWKPV